jgi:methylmalonyl-CoA mutase
VLPYHNLNCDAAYEIAITLAALVEYLEGLPVNSLPEAPASVRMGVSCDYFVQIAKFRATRRLWALLMKDYNCENKITIVAESSLTNKTISDPFNNLIRTSIEAMAAIAGCCLNFILSDFDKFAGAEAGFSERLSLHQGLIMEKEAYLATMTDIGFRSYYVENLTDMMAESALKIFKRIENQGGYFTCIEKGIFDSEIGEQATRKQKEFMEGKRLSVGVNIFPDKDEKNNLSSEQIASLRSLKVNNPALSFELDQLK